MRELLLSVVVPIYNVEKYLSQCIESIINQTYRNLEIILVDDGSTDASGKIADIYQKQDNRIKVIHKENGGLISARYAGIKAACGNYCTFVDSDDWIKPDMYEVLMNIMLEYAVDLVTSGCIRYYNEEKQNVSYDKNIIQGFYDADKIKECILPIMLRDERTEKWALDPSTCFKIYKREKLFSIMSKIKDEKFYYGEDTVITYSYMLLAKSIYCTNKIFYYHRQRIDGKVAPYLIKKDFFKDLLMVYEYLYEVFNAHELKEILIKQLDYFFIRSARYKQLKYENSVRVKGESYLFPYNKIDVNSKIVIYGAGRVGQDYAEQLNKMQYGNFVLWIDKDYKLLNERINSPESIMSIDFDYVIIAVARDDAASEIKNWLISKGISNEKIVHSIVKY